jgi:hypothetical protein
MPYRRCAGYDGYAPPHRVRLGCLCLPDLAAAIPLVMPPTPPGGIHAAGAVTIVGLQLGGRLMKGRGEGSGWVEISKIFQPTVWHIRPQFHSPEPHHTSTPRKISERFPQKPERWGAYAGEWDFMTATTTLPRHSGLRAQDRPGPPVVAAHGQADGVVASACVAVASVPLPAAETHTGHDVPGTPYPRQDGQPSFIQGIHAGKDLSISIPVKLASRGATASSAHEGGSQGPDSIGYNEGQIESDSHMFVSAHLIPADRATKSNS